MYKGHRSIALHSNVNAYTQTSITVCQIRYPYLSGGAKEAAGEIELAPSLAVKVFVVRPTAELVETDPTVVEIVLTAPEEFDVEVAPTAAEVAIVAPVGIVVAIVPIVAAASIDFVGMPAVAEEKLALHELYDRCEGAAKCTTLAVSPML